MKPQGAKIWRKIWKLHSLECWKMTFQTDEPTFLLEFKVNNGFSYFLRVQAWEIK